MTEPTRLEELGDRVRAWRLALYSSQDEAAAAGGTSVPTWRKVEQGRPDVTDRTYAAVDKAFGWRGGFTARAAAGQEDLPDWPSTDEPSVAYRTGLTDDDLQEQHSLELRAATSERLMTIIFEVGSMIGKSVGRLGLEVLDHRTLNPPSDDFVLDRAGRPTVIEARTDKPRNEDDQNRKLQQLVGLRTIWQRQGVERMILFTLVDWPRELVDQLAGYGIEYASSQDQLEAILSVHGSSRG